MTHPLAFKHTRNGAHGMSAGDRVRYMLNGRIGIADEFLSDGEALITWDDGSHGCVKWNLLMPAPVEED